MPPLQNSAPERVRRMPEVDEDAVALCDPLPSISSALPGLMLPATLATVGLPGNRVARGMR